MKAARGTRNNKVIAISTTPILTMTASDHPKWLNISAMPSNSLNLPTELKSTNAVNKPLSAQSTILDLPSLLGSASIGAGRLCVGWSWLKPCQLVFNFGIDRDVSRVDVFEEVDQCRDDSPS